MAHDLRAPGVTSVPRSGSPVAGLANVDHRGPHRSLRDPAVTTIRDAQTHCRIDTFTSSSNPRNAAAPRRRADRRIEICCQQPSLVVQARPKHVGGGAPTRAARPPQPRDGGANSRPSTTQFGNAMRRSDFRPSMAVIHRQTCCIATSHAHVALGDTPETRFE
jgi:hypothetical protein